MKAFAVVLLSSIFLLYGRLYSGFFQQDEWFGYSWYLLHKDLGFLDTILFYFAPSVGHYNPLTIAAINFLFDLWGINYQGFLTVSLIFHFLNSLAVFYLLKEIFGKEKRIAFFGSLLFAVLGAPFESTAWVIANIGTHFSSLLGILSAIFFFKFLKSGKTKVLILSLVLVLISLLFKEITVGLFAVYFILYFFQGKKKRERKNMACIIFFGVFYMGVRVLMFFGPNITSDQVVTQSQPVVKLVYNFMTIPLKSISQTIIPLNVLKPLSFAVSGLFPEKVAGVYQSPEFEAFAVKRIMESISLGISVLILAGLPFLYKKSKDEISDPLIAGLIWTLANSLIFSLSPEKSGVVFSVDSRNLYFSSIGVIIMISGFIQLFPKHSFKKAAFIFAVLILFNSLSLYASLSDFSSKGEIRKLVLQEILFRYPTLPEKAVFYTQSDSSYYGLSENTKILPFQSGLGQTLLSYYYETEKFPLSFFEDRFLWDIESQGYKEVDGRGFGYFRDYNLLEQTLSEYNLPQSSVIAFGWISKENRLVDISGEIRQRLFEK